MLQIASGRFFRPGVPLNERIHRRIVYSNAWFLDQDPIALPVGTIIGSDDIGEVTSATLEVVDRLETTRPDGTDELLIATSGEELINDLADVMTFALNRTVSTDHDLVHRLVPHVGDTRRRRRGAASLFPKLFEPMATVQPDELTDLKQLMDELLALRRQDYVRVMRVIRNTVDATRRAIDDPTGAYTDLVAALESLADAELSVPTAWDRYDGKKRKIIDSSLDGADPERIEKVHAAVLEADRVGLKRRFVSSTMARVSDSYYRAEAADAAWPPRSADLERLLSLAYDIRSRRSHILEDLGDEAWVFTDGAETVFEPRFQRILTLAGLWRLVRHVVRRYVTDAPKPEPEPWDYRGELPGIVQMQLAPQYWVWVPDGLDAASASTRFNGVAEALIAWLAGDNKEGFNLSQLLEPIEQLVPGLPDGEPKAALVAIYHLWHEWTDPNEHSSRAAALLATHRVALDTPSPTAFAASLLSRQWRTSEWSADDWAALATARREARVRGKEPPLPAAVDVLLQLESADQLEAAGRHDEAVVFAANAVEEHPGHPDLLDWERRLIAGDHDPAFDVRAFLLGKNAERVQPSATEQAAGEADASQAADEPDIDATVETAGAELTSDASAPASETSSSGEVDEGGGTSPTPPQTGHGSPSP